MEANIIIEKTQFRMTSKTLKYDKYCKTGVMFLVYFIV